MVSSKKQEDKSLKYFKSEQAKVIFLLVYMSGKRRNEHLGITSEMYENKKLARKWYKRLATLTHPDKEGGDAVAFNNLVSLYTIMTDDWGCDIDITIKNPTTWTF